MTEGSRPRAGWVALATTALTVGLGWWVDAHGIRDGAGYGIGGAPVDVALTPDGSRLLVAAADDRAVWVLDASTGHRLTRQGLDAAPVRFVPIRGAGRPVVLFDAATELCAVHSFRERTLASCFEPGEPDVSDAHEPTPIVIGAVEDPGAGLVVALARAGGRDPAVRLRRYVADPGERHWRPRGDSPWVRVSQQAVSAPPSSMAWVAGTRRILLAIPGTERLLIFASSLIFEGEIELGPHTSGLAVDESGEVAYATDARLGEVWKLALPTGQVLARAGVGPGAQSVSLDETRRMVWVASRFSPHLVGLDADTLAPMVRVPVRDGTGAAVVDPSRGRLFAVNSRHGTVSSWRLPSVELTPPEAGDRAVAVWWDTGSE